jgi:hypothetical protein
MKQRNGFVSNSSSSSFCCFGVALNALPEKLEDADPWEVTEKAKLRLYNDVCGEDGCDISQYVIGLEPDEMADTQTLGEFKQQIANAVNRLLKKYGDKEKKYEVKFYSGQSGC